jgi:hypothetical protein
VDYLLYLSRADGADLTRAADTDTDPLPNGEPDGELSVAIRKDFARRDQTGARADSQPGNTDRIVHDVLRTADFNGRTPRGSAIDSARFTVSGGTCQALPPSSPAIRRLSCCSEATVPAEG